MFAYCGSNPVTRADSSGHAWYDRVSYWFLSLLGTLSRTPKQQQLISKVNNSFLDQDDSTTTSNKIINNQNSDTLSRFTCGSYSASYNGCGEIAVHNAKVLKGIDSSLSDTISDFEDAGVIIGDGMLGSNPYAIGTVLKKSNIAYSYVDGPLSMTSPGTYIISYSWDGTINSGAHIVAVQFDGIAYTTYNYYGDGKTYNHSPLAYAQNYICGYYLG